MPKPRNRLTPRTYHEIAELVTAAVSYGYRRAYKHTLRPSEEHVVECIEREVMGVVADVVEFPHEKEH